MTTKNGFAENKRYYEEMFKRNDDAHERIMLALGNIEDKLNINHEDLAVFKMDMKHRSGLMGFLAGLIPALAAFIYWILKGKT